MKLTPSKSKTPTKTHNILQRSQPRSQQQQTPESAYKLCMKILTSQSQQEITKYLINNKLTSFALKSQKCLHILNITLQAFKAMMVQNQDSSAYLTRIINNYKKNYRKAEEFCRLLKHFADKDYQFLFIQEVAKCQNSQSVGFYIKCRNSIIESFLNKTKKELLANVYGNQEQWYKITQKIFKNVRREHLIELFTDVIKYHYQNIKKNQNEELNGAEIFRIFQIMNRNLKQAKNSQLYSFDERDEAYMTASRAHDKEGDNNTVKGKQKQVKRLFDKNVVDGLQSEDRELIRILSYKDQNIAKLLEKKHEKMIELIAEDVENMRKSIQIEKEKYLQLWKQKQQIIKAADTLNYLSLNYIANDSADNEEKLIRAIEAFNSKHKQNSDTVAQARKMRQARKNRRLIELIQKEQKEKC